MDPTNEDLNPKRTIPVCFSQDSLRIVADYAKRKGMLDFSQAVEHLAKKTREK